MGKNSKPEEITHTPTSESDATNGSKTDVMQLDEKERQPKMLTLCSLEAFLFL
jgi:hypothetical protein